jgi:leader peptidase (prepilin peptidase)/N-methyltransferase
MENLVLTMVVFSGLALGSFFNVLIVRLPKNEFFRYPRSVCPHCGHRIRAYDNIPVLSYVILRAKCRDCGGPISAQYPAVEILTALLAVFLYLCQDWPLRQPAVLAWQAGASFLLLFLVPLSIIDIRHRIIPDGLSLGGLAAGLLLAFLPGGRNVPDAFLGALCGGGVLFTLGWIGRLALKKDAMGGGDIKLMAAAGALLGPPLVLLAFLIGSVAGSLVGLYILLKKGRSDLPFGPALAGGILISFLYGGQIIRWYMGFL